MSVGYFVADFVHFVLFEPDFLFFFHHVFSIGMMGSAGIIGRGAGAATAAIVQGEITNPFQSAWTVARFAKAQRALVVLSPLFTFAFVSVRLSLVPYWSYLINVNLWFGPNHSAVPFAVVASWSAMSVFMVVGGFAWSYSLIKGLIKFYSKSADKTSKKRN